MNVLLLTKYDLSQGGVADVLKSLIRYLPESDVFPTVYSCNPSAGNIPDGAEIGHLPHPGALNLFKNKKIVNRLLQLCRERNIALIHAHGAYRPAYAAQLLAEKLAIPYVVTSHGDIIPSASKRMRTESGRKRIGRYLSGAAALTHLNTYMAAIAEPLSGSAPKNVIIPNGVELSHWHGHSAGTCAPLAGKYIVGIGRLATGKGFVFLLNAYREALNNGLQQSLVIVGDGPERVALVEHARQLGLQVGDESEFLAGGQKACVYFVGYKCGAAKTDYLAHAHFVVFPSQAEEAFGIVLLEAMAARKALAVCALPATKCLIEHGENGLITACGDTAAFSKSLLSLANDHKLRLQFEKRNQQTVRDYDWRTLVRKYADLYSQTVRAYKS